MKDGKLKDKFHLKSDKIFKLQRQNVKSNKGGNFFKLIFKNIVKQRQILTYMMKIHCSKH